MVRRDEDSEIEWRDNSPGVLDFARASKKGSLRVEFRDAISIIFATFLQKISPNILMTYCCFHL
jgi:hypothetical protein